MALPMILLLVVDDAEGGLAEKPPEILSKILGLDLSSGVEVFLFLTKN